MTTFSPEFVAAKIKFGALLEQYGWTSVEEHKQDWAIGTATKEVATIVAPNTAVAYFSPSSEYLAMLGGTFVSKGEDAYSAMWMPVAHGITDEELAELAKKYAEESERRIGNAWSVRLLRQRQEAERDPE
ncbi:hypothetical protein ACSVIJ_04900 [Pseudomonas sp. NCHU5208]|uniref:hypothetical protein n=1 Tax=unclassified Pseudomonas TaxID=196821 RepID=UPI003F9C5FBE